MRRLYCSPILASSLVIIGSTLACQQAPRPSPPDTRAADESAVREADAAWSKAAAAKDVEAYVGFLAEDALELPPNAPMLTGKESMRKGLSEEMANPGFVLSWQVNKAEASRGGDLAYSIGTYQSTMNDAKGKPVTDRGKYVTVWKKQADGTWKVVADIYNSDLPAPEAPKH
jgi:ketosteroid isomerase-like protein